MRLRIAGTVILLGLCACTPLATGVTVVLVDQHHPPCPIVLRTPPSAADDLAAKELARYLQQISGAEFPVQRLAPADALPTRAIVIGAGGTTLPADLGGDGFVMQTQGERLHLAGAGAQGTLYSIYAFLEDELGCRWWSWNEEDVPQRPTLRVKGLDVTVRPAFSLHDLLNQEAQTGKNNFAYKCRSKSWEQFSGGHTLCPLLKPAAEQRPEFLPLNAKGERVYNDLHMDYSAAGMSEALAEALGKQVLAKGSNVASTIYFAGMGDWYGGMCECAPCKQVYEQETWTDPDGNRKPGYTATLLRMINRTAELLEAQHPGIRVGTFAYMSLEAPPATVTPRDNVVLWVPRLRHDTGLSVLESEKNRSFLRNLERWCEVAPGRVYVWEYGANFHSFLQPFPCLRSIAENIKHYHALGVRGIMVQGNYVSTGGDLAVLKNYVWRKLLWDPALDTDKLIAEFCRGYYGPAAKTLIRYVQTVEELVRRPQQIHVTEFDEPRKTYLTDERIATLSAILEEALAHSAGHAPYDRRVREAQASLEAAVLWNEGPLAEADGRLIRADLKSDTYPRALALVEHLREAAAREWGQGRAYRMEFLTWHGGPLPTLSAGELQVKVAPAQRGRIWSVTWAGKEVMGQSVEHLNPGARGYEMVGANTATRVETQAELGIGNWSPNTKQIAHKTVELAADGAILISGGVRRLNDEVKTLAATVETQYRVGNDPGSIRVATRAAGGTWQDVAISGDKIEVDRPACSQVRIVRPAERVEVVDEILAPGVGGTKITYDRTTGLITTLVSLEAVPAPTTPEGVYLQRRITVRPLEK
jgi:hypothetical protein